MTDQETPRRTIWTNPTSAGPIAARLGEGVVAAYSRPSPSRPAVNEDSMAVVPLASGGLLLAIADGCGGMPAGDRASRVAIEAFAASVDQSRGDTASAVIGAFDRANEAVVAMRLGSGSTLTVVAIDGHEARVFHAGDSPAAVIGQRGVLRYATLPHSPVGFGVEAGLLSERDATDHEERGVVLNVLGFGDMFVHVGPVVGLRPMDTVIVASDALSDNLAADRICALTIRGTASRALGSVVAETERAMGDVARGRPDDFSVLLYRPRRRRGD